MTGDPTGDSEVGDTSTAPSTSTTPTTGVPTTGTTGTTGTPDTSDVTGGPDTTEHGDTTIPETTGGETTTGATETTGDETAGEAVCGDPWDQPSACTSPACESVTRAWVLCDKAAYEDEMLEYRFAADSSVLTRVNADADPHTEVLRISPEGQTEVLLAEKLQFAQIEINRTAVDFSVYEVDGGDPLRVISDQGELLTTYPQSQCGRTWLIPDSTGTVHMDGSYLMDRTCDFKNVSILDAQGTPQGSWAPEGDYIHTEVTTTGVYNAVIDNTLIRHTLDGKLKWTVDILYSDHFAAATHVDRQVTQADGGILHVIDGKPVGPVDVWGHLLRIAPHGEFSAVGSQYGDKVHRFADGELIDTIDIGFASTRELDVSDLGEIAVWGYTADVAQWVTLYGADGEIMWKVKVQDHESYKGVVFSPSGDELLIRETDALSMFQIHR